MAFEFRFPDIGEGLTEAVVVKWHVGLGDHLDLDGPMVEVETDKAVTEIPAPREGVVLHLGAAEGDTIEVDQILVVIGEEGESWQPAAEAERSPAAAAPIVGTLDERAEVLGAPQALPRVRKLAADLGVDLGTVTGTGPGGRLTEDDVRAAAVQVDSTGPIERVRLSATRRAIAEHLSRSWREIPHVTTYGDADAAGLLAARKRLAEETRESVPLEALLIDAVLPVLREIPESNATLRDDYLLLRKHYDIGVAVDTPDGLMVAVVRHADSRDVTGLAAEVTRLAAAARDRTARAEDLSGATFTISNIGAVGGRYGTPIVPYGTTAILSVGRADPTPAAVDGEVVVARRFPLSLSYDHRVVDGALGRRFMAAVIDRIEGYGR